MRILTALTYYRPHTSGLTIYAERLARALVARGHEVTILTTQFDASLPKREVLEGVQVIRAPVLARISKGVISPTLGLIATREALRHDVIHLHLPQFDAAGIALRGKIFRLPVVITYHCDILLPPGIINSAAQKAIHLMDNIAGGLADKVVTYTQDYGDNSPFLKRFRHKREVISPPVELPQTDSATTDAFRAAHLSSGRTPIVAMAARLASEKGVEILLAAIPRVLERFPNLQVLFAGQYQDVLGEIEYFRRLEPTIRDFEARGVWKFLGVLSMKQMASLYRCLDLLVVPSLNSTESFGLVQVEALMNGVPVISSNLPGVRQTALQSKYGEVVEIGDSAALAEAMIRVLEKREDFRSPPQEFLRQFQVETVAERYEQLYLSLLYKS